MTTEPGTRASAVVETRGNHSGSDHMTKQKTTDDARPQSLGHSATPKPTKAVRVTRRTAAIERKRAFLLNSNETWGIGSETSVKCLSCPRKQTNTDRKVTFGVNHGAASEATDLLSAIDRATDATGSYSQESAAAAGIDVVTRKDGESEVVPSNDPAQVEIDDSGSSLKIKNSAQQKEVCDDETLSTGNIRVSEHPKKRSHKKQKKKQPNDVQTGAALTLQEIDTNSPEPVKCLSKDANIHPVVDVTDRSHDGSGLQVREDIDRALNSSLSVQLCSNSVSGATSHSVEPDSGSRRKSNRRSSVTENPHLPAVRHRQKDIDKGYNDNTVQNSSRQTVSRKGRRGSQGDRGEKHVTESPTKETNSLLRNTKKARKKKKETAATTSLDTEQRQTRDVEQCSETARPAAAATQQNIGETLKLTPRNNNTETRNDRRVSLDMSGPADGPDSEISDQSWLRHGWLNTSTGKLITYQSRRKPQRKQISNDADDESLKDFLGDVTSGMDGISAIDEMQTGTDHTVQDPTVIDPDILECPEDTGLNKDGEDVYNFESIMQTGIVTVGESDADLQNEPWLSSVNRKSDQHPRPDHGGTPRASRRSSLTKQPLQTPKSHTQEVHSQARVSDGNRKPGKPSSLGDVASSPFTPRVKRKTEEWEAGLHIAAVEVRF